MFYLFLADLVLIFHALFVIFVILGGLIVLRWPKVIIIHIPCFAWGVILELQGWICPLTYLENDLLIAGGKRGYTGDFIQHYLHPVVYPPGITSENQFVLGILALVINLLVYGVACWTWLRIK